MFSAIQTAEIVEGHLRTLLKDIYGFLTLKELKVVYHLPKNSGIFGWDVNGKTVLVCPNGNFPK